MNKLLSDVKSIKHFLIEKSFKSGFAYVFTGQIVSYLVAFCGSIIYARLLGPQDFGSYSFANNIVQFFLLLNGFGVASGVLQFVSRSASLDIQQSYLFHAIKIGFIFNLLLSGLICAYIFLVPIPIASSRYLLLGMSFFPIGRLYIDINQAFLRATSQNKKLASYLITTNGVLLFLNVTGVIYYGVYGLIIATYIGYLIVIILSHWLFRLPNVFRIKLKSINVREFVSYSGYAISGNAFSQLVYILDIFMLGYIIHDAQIVAQYKVATVIPFALNFIPGVISLFFYPQFAQNASDKAYIKRLYGKVMTGLFVFSLSVSLFLIFAAPIIIELLFGKKYESSILPFQILSGGFFVVATFRTLSGNVLASLGKARFAMILNFVIMLVNVLVTYVLIRFYGMIGAALGVVFVYTISSLIAVFSLNKFLKD